MASCGQIRHPSFIKKLYVSADSNVKNINFRNKVSLRITRNGSDVHIDFTCDLTVKVI